MQSLNKSVRRQPQLRCTNGSTVVVVAGMLFTCLTISLADDTLTTAEHPVEPSTFELRGSQQPAVTAETGSADLASDTSSPSAEDKRPSMSLHRAVLMTNTKHIEEYLVKARKEKAEGKGDGGEHGYGGIDEPIARNRNRTALHIAVKEGRTKTVKLLLEAGASLEKKDTAGYACMHFAAEHGRLEIIDLLVDLGASVDVQNKNLYTD